MTTSTIIFGLFYVLSVASAKYEPTWKSLDTRPIPAWYDQAKVGIFLHWGVYSVPGYGSEWFWKHWKENKNPGAISFMKENYRPGFTYQEFAPEFTAKFFNATKWAKLFKAAGARYVVLTSKHHEGYTLWPSTYSYSWNAMDVGAHRDLLGELTEAVRNESLTMGYYYSLLEWFHPRYMADQAANFTTTFFSDYKVQPELRELVENYKPDIVWSDGEWEASDDYWRSKEFLAWLYNESPVRDTVVANDRWGKGMLCHHGDFYTCVDRYNPGVLQPHKWENAMTLDRFSWGYREKSSLSDYMSTYELIKTLVEAVSCGGNILINVGPTKDGLIAPIFEERLLDLGKWLSVNGEAIYSSKPWKVQNDTLGKTWYTAKSNAVYAISLEWPSNGVVRLGSAWDLFSTEPLVQLLGYGDVSWNFQENLTETISITLPDKAEVTSHWAWVFKIYQPAILKFL